MQKNVELRKKQYLQLKNDRGRISYGCDQDWYHGTFQRLAGCGPTAATNNLIYMQRAGRYDFRLSVDTLAQCVALMHTIWEYVTPTPLGLYKTSFYQRGINRFFATKGYPLRCDVFPVHGSNSVNYHSAVNFIASHLRDECPVSFLNLCNGAVDNMDKWHWITIVGISYTQDMGHITVEVFDAGNHKFLDLRKWLQTCTLPGGFCSYSVKPSERSIQTLS